MTTLTGASTEAPNIRAATGQRPGGEGATATVAGVVVTAARAVGNLPLQSPDPSMVPEQPVRVQNSLGREQRIRVSPS